MIMEDSLSIKFPNNYFLVMMLWVSSLQVQLFSLQINNIVIYNINYKITDK